jgi:nucleotide-binding universal stress UspA family protein
METPPVKGSPEPRGPTIVVGYDGSEASRAAVRFAARRAGRRGRVFVVHAFDLPPDFLGAPNYDSLLGARQDHGRALLDALPLAGNDELLDLDYETELIGGPPAQAIPAVARVREADEIIVGARGLAGSRARGLGRVRRCSEASPTSCCTSPIGQCSSFRRLQSTVRTAARTLPASSRLTHLRATSQLRRRVVRAAGP